MKPNEASWDRVVRLLLAVAAVVGAVAVGAGSALGIVLLVVAVILAVTGLVGFCPIYAVLRTGTRRGDRA